VGNEKLASIGVNVSRGVTKHGFALNVAPDLAYFAGMIPCGIQDVAVTSLQRVLGEAPPMGAVVEAVVLHLATILGARVRPATPAEVGLPDAAAAGLLRVTISEEAKILQFPNKRRAAGSPAPAAGERE
jgi:hypothetical protein